MSRDKTTAQERRIWLSMPRCATPSDIRRLCRHVEALERSASSAEVSGLSEIVALMLELFATTDAFRIFISHGSSGSVVLRGTVSNTAPYRTQVEDAMKDMAARCLLNGEFFDRLLDKRPGKRERIEAVRAHYISGEPDAHMEH